ncbi:hypothetical protein R1flu_011276 [Riccia fluitans]|uniref:Uncharacterized protein n=1 Tax=Riccia fluitans TaxID=41844 RepID=A0ABD1Z8G2_9MARC
MRDEPVELNPFSTFLTPCSFPEFSGSIPHQLPQLLHSKLQLLLSTRLRSPLPIPENREKVKRDEEEAAREEAIRQQKASREETEFKLEKLREAETSNSIVRIADGAEQKTLKPSKSKKSVEDLRAERLSGRRSDGRLPHYHASFGNAR